MFPRIINGILIVLSIILGFFIAVAFAAGAMPYIRSVIKIDLILSTLFLLIYVGVLASSYFMNNPKIKSCLIVPGLTLLVASLGSIVSIMILLTFDISSVAFVSIMMVRICGIFFCLMLLTFIFFIFRVVFKSKRFPIC